MKKLNLLLILAITTIIACQPVNPAPTPTAYTPANPTPTFTNADAVLASIQTLTYQDVAGQSFSIAVDIAVATFFETNTSYYEAGLISVNSNDLTMNDNNSYTSVSTTGANTDLGFGANGNLWDVAGSTNAPTFTHTTTDGMPSDIKFSTNITTVNVSNNLTVAIESAPNRTDSIMYLVAGNSTTLTKIVAPSITSVEFTASELSGFSGSGVIQVAAYNFEFSDEAGKHIYYINETVLSNPITFE